VADLQTHVEVPVRIVSADHSQPPSVINNRLLTVDCEERIVIGQQDLEVQHPASAPAEIR
jgi:hypothetical protein